MTPKLFRLICLISALVAPLGRAADATSAADDRLWLTDIAKARAEAADEKRLVLLDFTGSDWCVWCHRLDGEILSQAPFLTYAQSSLVLVKVDFPKNLPQSEELVKQNRELAEKYSVEGYPTIVITDAQGKELGRTGYMYGGAKTFVRELKRIAAAKS